MTIPGKRLSKRRKHLRASHAALKPLALGVCQKCKKPILPHHVCAFCGYYRGRSFTLTPTKVTAKAEVSTTQKLSTSTAENKNPFHTGAAKNTPSAPSQTHRH